MELAARTISMPELEPQTAAETGSRTLPRFLFDATVIVILLVAGFFGSLFTQSKIDTRMYEYASGDNAFFQSDIPRVVEHMTDRKSDHYRIKVHPLFLLAGWPPVFALEKVLHIEQHRAIQLTIAAAAAAWLATFYGLLRLSGSRRLDSVIFTLLLCSSAAAITWTSVPETYLFGSVTLMLPLLLLAAAQYRKFGWKSYVVASALSMSMTITNWMSGIIVAAVSLRRRRAVRVTIYSFYLVVTLWGVQQAIFKNTPFFMDPSLERHFILRSEWGGPLYNFRGAMLYSMVMPAVQAVPLPPDPGSPLPPRVNFSMFTVQRSSLASAGVVGDAALAGWVLLLVIGAAGLCFTRGQTQWRLALGAVILGQIGLHTVYGEESFLYAAHYLPLLILLAAWGARTKLRPAVLALAGIVIVLSFYNNGMRFKQLAAGVTAHCDLHWKDVVVRTPPPQG